MDEVLEKLQSLGENKSPNKKTEYEDLYKNRGRLNNQEERRRNILESQKSNRNNNLDKFRGILNLVNSDQDTTFKTFKTNPAHYRPSIYVAGFNKTSPTYRDVLMLSEWLAAKPSDFHENWLVIPCPKAARMIVVANKGNTKCYSKIGHFKFETFTALPGGNRYEPKNQCTVLDCFYDRRNNVMYVLDLLAWNNQTFTDGETEFRHFWLASKFAENHHLRTLNRKNKILFCLLPKVPCEKQLFNRFMMTFPHFEGNYVELDGLLFYHKHGHYFSGETPLVGWLFPFMVNDVLGADITVNEKYLAERPKNYMNQAEYIEYFDGEVAAKRIRKNDYRSSTDTVTSEHEDQERKSIQESQIDMTEPEIVEIEIDATIVTPGFSAKNPLKKSSDAEDKPPKKFKPDLEMEDGSGDNTEIATQQSMPPE